MTSMQYKCVACGAKGSMCGMIPTDAVPGAFAVAGVMCNV